MAKLTINDLKKIKEKVEKEDQFRAGNKRVKLTVHMGTCGSLPVAKGSRYVHERISEANVTTCHHHLRLHASAAANLLQLLRSREGHIVYEFLTRTGPADIQADVLGGKVQRSLSCQEAESRRREIDKVFRSHILECGGTGLQGIRQ